MNPQIQTTLSNTTSQRAPVPSLIQSVIFALGITLTALVALRMGVHEKSLWQRYWDILTFGTLGAGMGLTFYLVFGGLGILGGPLHIGLHLVGLTLVGGLLGAGSGAPLHVLRNPSAFVFEWPLIAGILASGALVSVFASHKLPRMAREGGWIRLLVRTTDDSGWTTQVFSKP